MKTTIKSLTIREIRALLFDTDQYTLIDNEQMSNKESRDFLYNKDDQDKKMNVLDNTTHLLIWS